MSSPTVSVIVPVYNAEDFICRCVNSILTQFITDFEIILIDDGSTDSTASTCRRLVDSDPRVHYFYQKNAGVSAARNAGIKKASGEFITFVDADDWLDKNYLRSLIEKQELHDVDWVVCEYANHRDYSENKDIRVIFDEDVYVTGADIKSVVTEHILYNPGRSTLGAPFPKLFRRSIIEEHNIRFPEQLKIYEDVMFNFTYSQYINSFYYIHEPYYNRYMHADSAIHAMHPDIYSEMEAVCNEFQHLKQEFGYDSDGEMCFTLLLFYDILHLNVFNPDNKSLRIKKYAEYYSFLDREPMKSMWKKVEPLKCKTPKERLKAELMKRRQLGILETMYKVYYSGGR